MDTRDTAPYDDLDARTAGHEPEEGRTEAISGLDPAAGTIPALLVELASAARVRQQPNDDWTPAQVQISGGDYAGQLIIGAHEYRGVVTLVNTAASGGSTIYLGKSASVSASQGFPLLPGASVTITHRRAVYGVTSGAAVTVGVLAEYQQ